MFVCLSIDDLNDENPEGYEGHKEEVTAWFEDGQGGFYQDTLTIDAVGKGKSKGKP